MTTTSPGGIHRTDRITIGVLGVIVAAITVATFFWIIAGAIQTITALGETSVQLLINGEVPNSGTPGGPGIVSATYSTADVVATGLSDGTRWLLGGAAITIALTVAAVGGGVAWFLLMFGAKRVFQRSLFTTTLIAGFALLLGPILAVGLNGLAHMQAAFELNPLVDDAFIPGFTIDGLGFVVPVLGFVVLTLAFVFRAGERMQRDTEGLI